MDAQMVLGVAPTSDISRARSFYLDTLGLSEFEGPSVPESLLVQSGNSAFLVYQTQAKSGDATVLSFLVKDLDKVMKDLRDKGVKFEDYDLPGLKTENGVAEDPQMRAAWFKDPDGNVIAIGEAAFDLGL